MGCNSSKEIKSCLIKSCLYVHWSGLKTWFSYSDKEIVQKMSFIPDIKDYEIINLPAIPWISKDGTEHRILVYILISNSKEKRSYNELANKYYSIINKKQNLDIKYDLYGSIIFECSFSNSKYEDEFIKLRNELDL